MDLPDFSINCNRTAAQLRRAGAMLLLFGLLLTAIGGALLAVALGVPAPSFLIPDSIRIETQNHPQAAPVGALIFLSYITAMGIGFSAAGTWQILFGKINKPLLRVVLIIAALFFVAGIVASALLGRRIGSFNA